MAHFDMEDRDTGAFQGLIDKRIPSFTIRSVMGSVVEHGTYSKGKRGYYFISDKGGYCGLIEGMIVRYKSA